MGPSHPPVYMCAPPHTCVPFVVDNFRTARVRHAVNDNAITSSSSSSSLGPDRRKSESVRRHVTYLDPNFGTGWGGGFNFETNKSVTQDAL